MTWQCPECGIKNEGVSECACGYSFYKILGIQPNSSEEAVKQTYKYLINLWQTDSVSDDPVAKKKAEERLKKIKQTYNAFRDYKSAGAGADGKSAAAKKISFAAIIVLCIIILVVYLTTSKEQPKEQTSAQPPAQTQALPANQADIPKAPDAAPKPFAEPSRDKNGQPAFPETTVNPYGAPVGGRTEEDAIASVKKSNVIDHFFDVGAIIKKWSDENSGKFQIIGWKAKKMDEQIFMVSYTATDGLVTKGFYFDVDFSTGAVRHLANHPELQKKYGIQYNQ